MYDSFHELILILRVWKLSLRAKFKFHPWCQGRNACRISKIDILENKKTCYFQIITPAVWFSVFQWKLADLFNDRFLFFRINLQGFAWIVLEICNPKFEKWGKRKSSFVPMLRQEKLSDLFLVFPARLAKWPKAFQWYSFIKLTRNEAFRHFLVHSIKRLPWKRRTLQKFWLRFPLYIPEFIWLYEVWLPSSGRKKCYQ